jgi:hypothetical protein
MNEDDFFDELSSLKLSRKCDSLEDVLEMVEDMQGDIESLEAEANELQLAGRGGVSRRAAC